MSALQRQNYCEECEVITNELLQMLFNSSYCFQAMTNYFSKSDVALKGFAAFTDCLGQRMWTLSRRLMAYQTLRGGENILGDIKKPSQATWTNPAEAYNCALTCLKAVNEKCDELSKMAVQKGCGNVFLFVQAHLVTELLMHLKFVAEGVNRLSMTATDSDGYPNMLYSYDEVLCDHVKSLCTADSLAARAQARACCTPFPGWMNDVGNFSCEMKYN